MGETSFLVSLETLSLTIPAQDIISITGLKGFSEHSYAVLMCSLISSLHFVLLPKFCPGRMKGEQIKCGEPVGCLLSLLFLVLVLWKWRWSLPSFDLGTCDQ